ncbi:MAG: hypothetical protein MI920_09695, partial [Kiloniellales bacterium]|nr:hypothetical protein [Kiloniellales bacterium]
LGLLSMKKAFAGIKIAPHAEERSTERVSKHAGCLSSAPSLLSFLSQKAGPILARTFATLTGEVAFL